MLSHLVPSFSKLTASTIVGNMTATSKTFGYLGRNRYEVYPYIAKVKICFSCHRVGHISKNCKSKARCLFCGNDTHESPSNCPKKDDNPYCINCQGEHLANFRDCPLIMKHRMILSLAASENIPLIEAKRKILQSTITPKDITYDFINFPLLSSKKFYHNNNINNNSNPILQNSQQHHTPIVPQYNCFAILDTLDHSTDMFENSPPSPISLSHNSFKNNKPTFTQTVLRSRDNNSSCLNKSPQRSNKNNRDNTFNEHRNILNAPNGRFPISPGNGLGYNAQPNSNHNTGNSSPSHTRNNSQETLPQHITNGNEHDYAGSTVKNVDIITLNNVFSSLFQNLDCIYNMIRSTHSPQNDGPFPYPHSKSTNIRKE